MGNCEPWDSRAYETERASAVARGHDLTRWHCDNDAHVRAWRQFDGYAARPFRFEDLNGGREPERWGPTYPKTASAAVEKWRAFTRGRELTGDETRAYGQAVGQWIRGLNAPKKAPDTLGERTNAPSGQPFEFDCAKHRAKLRAVLAAQAAADRLAWASGKAKGFAVGERDLTIEQVYARAMNAKRNLALREAA